MDEETPLFGITPEAWATTPRSVQLAFGTLLDMVKELTAKMRVLEAQVAQTSRNSSKPPSSDPPSAPPPPPRVPRGKPGAQAGHPDQQRELLPTEHVDETVVLHPQRCPDCHCELSHDLPDARAPERRQVWELVPRLVHVTEYQRRIVDCPDCGHLLIASPPADLPAGVCCGPNLTALTGLLHGRFRLSMRETSAFLSEVVGVALALGTVVGTCARVSAALAPVDAAIQQHIEQQDVVWVDETSWREQQVRGWLWVAVCPSATCFRINPSRGQAVVQALLGKAFRGFVHSDRASAYHLLPSTRRQLCGAHLVRNLQGLSDQKHAESPRAERMLRVASTVFDVWHVSRGGFFDQFALQQALIPVRLALHECLENGRRCGWDKMEAFCRDLLTHEVALWNFSRVAGMEPTNNRAERALRPAVVWRKTCWGTQSARGSRFVERLLSVRATCAQHGRNLFAFLSAALRASFSRQPPPSIFVNP